MTVIAVPMISFAIALAFAAGWLADLVRTESFPLDSDETGE